MLILSSFAFFPAQAQTLQPQTPQPAQTQPPAASSATPIAPKPTRTLILLDPAHGGPDTGAHLSGNASEKDITLAFNNRLRALLITANFAVISTRTADPGTVFTTDQRAEIANHDHPAVCLILHATSSGSGIHLFTSALTPPSASAHPPHILHWDTAQLSSIPASLSLANEIGAALLNAKLPVILGQASVPPIDNLTCPAIAIELAPLSGSGSTPTPATNTDYQQHAAQAIATALTSWRSKTTADKATDGAAPQ